MNIRDLVHHSVGAAKELKRFNVFILCAPHSGQRKRNREAGQWSKTYWPALPVTSLSLTPTNLWNRKGNYVFDSFSFHFYKLIVGDRNFIFSFYLFSGQLRTLGAGQREKIKRKYVPVRLYTCYFSLLLGRGSDRDSERCFAGPVKGKVLNSLFFFNSRLSQKETGKWAENIEKEIRELRHSLGARSAFLFLARQFPEHSVAGREEKEIPKTVDCGCMSMEMLIASRHPQSGAYASFLFFLWPALSSLIS